MNTNILKPGQRRKITRIKGVDNFLKDRIVRRVTEWTTHTSCLPSINKKQVASEEISVIPNLPSCVETTVSLTVDSHPRRCVGDTLELV